MNRAKNIVIYLTLAFILNGCASVSSPANSAKEKIENIKEDIASSKKTLNYILRTYFNESMPVIEQKEKMDVNIKGLWKDLGIPKEEISWKLEDGAREHTLFFDPRLDTADSHPYLNYNVVSSGTATDIYDEYNILVLTKDVWEYQLLLFKKAGNNESADSNFVSAVVLKDTGGYAISPEFYKTKDGSLLFSIIEVGGRGTDVFSDYWSFYALVEGKLKKVLSTLKSGRMSGWSLLFEREYDSVLMPYSFTAPDIGFTYFVTYNGSNTYYKSRISDKNTPFELFKLRKDVYFKWDSKKKEFVLDRSRSQLNEDEVDGIFGDGEKEFYQKYKWRIQYLKLFGDTQQREWAGIFERGVSGKTDRVWNEQKKSYEEVPVKSIQKEKEVSSARDEIDYFRYIGLQIGAIDIDMSYFFGWDYDNKKGMKLESEKAIHKLKEIKKTVSVLDVPDEMTKTKKYYLEYIDRIISLYSGVESKTGKQVGDEYDALRKFMDENEVKINIPLAVKYLFPEELPEGFDRLVEETKGAKTKQDREEYLNSLRLIDNGKIKEAHSRLNGLLKRYDSGPFEKSILLRISDCIMIAEPGVDLGTNEGGEKILAGIINSKEYSPVLLEAYEKWRSVYQSNNEGMSNFSEIPNDEYNKKRWEVVGVIKDYIKENPKDIWAKEQVNALLNSPNIARGTPMGNYNLLYYGWFYYDMFEKDRKKFYKLSQLKFDGSSGKKEESKKTDKEK